MRSGTALIGAILLGLGAVAPTRTEAGQGALPEAVSSLLKNCCVKCHGPAKAKARLILSTPGGIRQGGKKGPAVVPGDLRRSPLWERVEAEEMDQPSPRRRRPPPGHPRRGSRVGSRRRPGRRRCRAGKLECRCAGAGRCFQCPLSSESSQFPASPSPGRSLQ